MDEKPATPDPEDAESVPGCDVYVNDSTSDADLRLAEGGVA